MGLLAHKVYNPHRKPSKEKKNNGEYNANLMDRLNNYWKRNQSHLAKENSLSHQHHAMIHTCIVATAKFNELGLQLRSFAPLHSVGGIVIDSLQMVFAPVQ